MSRRVIFLAVAVIMVGGVLGFVRVTGGSSKTVSPAPHATAVSTATAKRPKVRPIKVPAAVMAERRYAVRLLPIVSRARHSFDAITRAAEHTRSLASLAQLCGRNIKNIGVQQDYVDGVPHPYAWYTRSGLLHWDILGIYHTMLGAAENCQTTAGNGDRTGADIAVSDMRHATSQLNRVVTHLDKLAAKAR